MKRIITCAKFLLLIVICSCSSAGKIVIDPSLYKEESAYVVFAESIFIKEYNGVHVRNSWYKNNNQKVIKVMLPPGESSFVMDVRASFGEGKSVRSIRVSNLDFKYDFEAGKKYTIGIFAGPNTGSVFRKERTVFFTIWDKAISNGNPGNSKKSSVIQSWDIAELGSAPREGPWYQNIIP